MNNMLDEEEANHELKPGSMIRKRRTAELISQTKFASKRIQKITADEIKAELNRFADQKKPNGEFKYSQSYINKIFSILQLLEIFQNGFNNRNNAGKIQRAVSDAVRKRCRIFVGILSEKADCSASIYLSSATWGSTDNRSVGETV